MPVPLLPQAFRRECEQLPPLAVCHYLRAALTRPSISHLVPSIRCRLLLLFGGEALHKEDCVELATRASKDRFALLEVPQASWRALAGGAALRCWLRVACALTLQAVLCRPACLRTRNGRKSWWA